MTRKQTKFVKAIAEGKPAYKAAALAYDIKSKDKMNVANAIAVENLQKPTIREAIDALMVKHNLTIDSALIPIKKGLSAKKVVQIEGDYFETEVDDLDMQLKASDRVLKLHGAYKDQGTGTNFHLHLNNNSTNYNL